MIITFFARGHRDLSALINQPDVGVGTGWMKMDARLEHEDGKPVWVTATSSYRYTRVSVTEDGEVWRYEGSGGAFLTQSLLPYLRKGGTAPLDSRMREIRRFLSCSESELSWPSKVELILNNVAEDISFDYAMNFIPDEWKEHFHLNRPARIISAVGSYGEFEGENALRKYRKVRDEWVSLCEERYPERASEPGFGHWCAKVFVSGENPLTKWEELAVEKLGYDCL